MPENCLVEIPIKDWPKLRDLYIHRKYESNSFNLVQNYINWVGKDPSTNANIYSLNGDWSDGTFLLKDSNMVMFNTRNDCKDRLFSLLNCLPENDSDCLYYGFPDHVRPVLERLITHLGLTPNPVTTIWYHIFLEDALNFSIDPPEGIALASLRQEHVDTINSIWPHRYPGSEKFVSRLITNNENIGAFDRDGNLLAWCLTLPIGSLGLLHVKDGYKRKGLGNLVTRVLSKKHAEMGTEVIAPVVENNVASRSMFKKLGFNEVDKVHWLQRPSK